MTESQRHQDDLVRKILEKGKKSVAPIAAGVVAGVFAACSSTGSGEKNESLPPTVGVSSSRSLETPSGIANEKSEEGWKTFRSINYPYQINIPSNWTANELKGGSEKIDLFERNTENILTYVRVSAKQVNSWVELDDYTDHFKNQESKASYSKVKHIINVKDIKSKEAEASGFKEYLSKQYGQGAIQQVQNLSNIKVNGEGTKFIASIEEIYGHEYYSFNALMKHGSQIYQFNLVTNPFSPDSFSNALETYREILSSFKFRE